MWQWRQNQIQPHQPGLPKTHWIDACCVGASTPERLRIKQITPLLIKAVGHGNRQMRGTDENGFPTRHRSRKKKHFGYQTGDLVRALVPKGKYRGKHVGRLTARATGSFDIHTGSRKAQGVSYQYCSPIHQADGYSYQKGVRHSSPA